MRGNDARGISNSSASSTCWRRRTKSWTYCSADSVEQCSGHCGELCSGFLASSQEQKTTPNQGSRSLIMQQACRGSFSTVSKQASQNSESNTRWNRGALDEIYQIYMRQIYIPLHLPDLKKITIFSSRMLLKFPPFLEENRGNFKDAFVARFVLKLWVKFQNKSCDKLYQTFTDEPRNADKCRASGQNCEKIGPALDLN